MYIKDNQDLLQALQELERFQTIQDPTPLDIQIQAACLDFVQAFIEERKLFFAAFTPQATPEKS